MVQDSRGSHPNTKRKCGSTLLTCLLTYLLAYLLTYLHTYLFHQRNTKRRWGRSWRPLHTVLVTSRVRVRVRVRDIPPCFIHLPSPLLIHHPSPLLIHHAKQSLFPLVPRLTPTQSCSWPLVLLLAKWEHHYCNEARRGEARRDAPCRPSGDYSNNSTTATARE